MHLSIITKGMTQEFQKVKCAVCKAKKIFFILSFVLILVPEIRDMICTYLLKFGAGIEGKWETFCFIT